MMLNVGLEIICAIDEAEQKVTEHNRWCFESVDLHNIEHVTVIV
jgi:hypothetical protein